MTDELTLGVDTSAGIAVGIATGEQILARDWIGDSRLHAELVMPMINQMCTTAGVGLDKIERLVVGMGPGPFTGLRVGIASAQALAFAAQIPLHRVCSLDVIAVAAARSFGGESSAVESASAEKFCVISDARRGELYWASYGRDGVRVRGPEVAAPDALPDLPVTGPGVPALPDANIRPILAGGPQRSDGGVLAQVGVTLPQVGAEPMYLRPADAVASATRKSTLVNRSGRIRLRGIR